MKIKIIERDPVGTILNQIDTETSDKKMNGEYNMYLPKSSFFIVDENNNMIGRFKILQDINTKEISVDFSNLRYTFFNPQNEGSHPDRV